MITWDYVADTALIIGILALAACILYGLVAMISDLWLLTIAWTRRHALAPRRTHADVKAMRDRMYGRDKLSQLTDLHHALPHETCQPMPGIGMPPGQVWPLRTIQTSPCGCQARQRPDGEWDGIPCDVHDTELWERLEKDVSQ